MDRDTGTGNAASDEPVCAPKEADRAWQVPVSFGLDSPKRAGLLERAEVT